MNELRQNMFEIQSFARDRFPPKGRAFPFAVVGNKTDVRKIAHEQVLENRMHKRNTSIKFDTRYFEMSNLTQTGIMEPLAHLVGRKLGNPNLILLRSSREQQA